MRADGSGTRPPRKRGRYAPLWIAWRRASRDPKALRVIRHGYNVAVWREHGSLGARVRLAAAFTLWPARAMQAAFRYVTGYGGTIERKTGKSRLRQWGEQVYLALRYSIDPYTYYRYQLYEESKFRAAGDFLLHEQSWRTILAYNAGPDTAVLDDKRLFLDACQRHGLVTIPVLAWFEAGEPVRIDDRVGWERDLFGKPAHSQGGQGARWWKHIGPGLYRDGDGRQVSREAIVDQCRALSRPRPYLLQPRLVNHPMIADLTSGALATLRIVTAGDRGAEPRFVSAVMKLPRGAQITDNLSSGSLIAPVDLATGTLGAAIADEIGAEWTDRHPDTGGLVAGRQLPDWPAPVAVCVAGHRCFDLSIVGWDVAITGEGVVVVEANVVPGFNTLQIAHQRPLGRTALAESLADRIERALATVEPRGRC